MNKNEQATISVKELAIRWKTSEQTIYNGLQAGQIPHLRAGKRRYVIPLQAILRIEENPSLQTGR